MPIDIDNLQPYAAFLLYSSGMKRLREADKVTRLEMLMEEIKTTLSGPGKTVVADGPFAKSGRVAGRVLQMQIASKPSWSKGSTITDVNQHLVILAECDGTLGVAVSDPQLRAEVGQFLNGNQSLKAIAYDVLENALMRSDIRTLWLRGLHRKTFSKADSKVLTGPQLESALNPLDDRTFMPSSARAGTGLPQSTMLRVIGVSPDRSYVWVGPTTNMTDFCRRFQSLVEFIAIRSKQPPRRLPILAQAIPNALQPSDVSKAFDFDFASPDSDVNLTDQERTQLEIAHSQLRIETYGHTDQNFVISVADLTQGNTKRPDTTWQVNVNVSLTDGRAIPVLAPDSDQWARWGDFRKLMGKRSLWSVWYETGHCLSAGHWTKVEPSVSSFNGVFFGAKFPAAKWSVEIEKPLIGKAVNWQAIGHDKSLFSWWIKEGMAACFKSVATNIDSTAFSYAICDDGSNELGDFIVLAKHKDFASDVNPSHLALIMVHMKAASDSKSRQMAPKRYEEVLGQATKNLGRVNFKEIGSYFLECAEGGKAPFWHWSNGRFRQLVAKGSVLAKGSAMHHDLSVFDGQRAHIHVVVVQPHQSAGDLASAMNAHSVDFKTRMLCTLLCAAEGAARASSAHLQVVMSE